jgi:hypothetical protein
MKKNSALAVWIATVGLATAGCIGYERKSSSLGPSSTGTAALVGTWTSSSAVPSPTACTDFRWTVTQHFGNNASGTFSATCPGDVKVSGTATGTLSGSTVTWTALGTASVPNFPSCAIALSGTAELGSDSIRVPYSGQTCLGPVSGVEILRKN